MGQAWDYDVPSVDIWQECFRVLKPGGHLLAFAGTRTQHRMAVNIEDAGFEIRDMIAWVYGSGFPKSMNVSKAIDKAAGVRGHDSVGFNVAGKTSGLGVIQRPELRSDHPDYVKPQGITPEAQQWEGWGTALKPALEPITVARKPLGERTVAANVLEHGTGALNIDGCRIKPSTAPGGREWEEQRNRAFLSAAIAALSDKLTGLERCPSTAAEPVGLTTNAKGESSHRATCRLATGCSDGTRAASTSTSLSTGEFGRMPTAQSLTDIASIIETASKPTIDWATWNSCQCPSTSAITSASITAALKSLKLAASSSSNVGTAGRWPSNLIHDGTDEVTQLFGDARRFFYVPKCNKKDREEGNTHPTVKPTALMAYLVRLITPPGGVVLDPFMGSGSTGKAAVREGFDFIGIEREEEYVAIASKRLQVIQRSILASRSADQNG